MKQTIVVGVLLAALTAFGVWAQTFPGTINGLRYGPNTTGLPTLATGEIYYDATAGFGEHNSALNISTDLGASAPGSVIPSQFNFAQCQGNNTTFVGCSGLFIQTQDRTGVVAGTKGVLYGLNINTRYMTKTVR